MSANDQAPDGDGKHARALAHTVAAPSVDGQSGVVNTGQLDPTMTGGLAVGEPESGTKLGERYQILGLIGFGGMGTVYRARDLELDEVVALKVLRRELLGSSEILDRFRREVKLARRVTHPNVARTFDIGEHQGEKFLTMEFVESESLADVLDREGRLTIERIAPILRQVCAGLGAAHAAGVVHRDLKPENVLVGQGGRVVVTDFGIARAFAHGEASSTVGVISGTPAYMAPEQVQLGATIDARADIYALGAMLFELCTGQRAWTGEAPIAVAAARLVHPPPDPRERGVRVSDPLAELVLRCMARDPAARPQTVEEVAAAVDGLAGVAAAAPVLSELPPSPPATISAAPSPPSVPQPAPASQSAGAEKTVAVLPFKNAGGPEDAYLAEGLTDEIIDGLSMTKGLRVRSLGAVLQRAGAARDPRDVGRELDVQVLVEGSVRRAADALRISCRVSSVHDGFQIWAQRFNRPAADLLVLGDEVTHAVGAALTVSSAAPARAAATDAEAVELYLRGRQEYRKFWHDHAVAAMELFEQAHRRAPGDATIMAACSLASWRVWFFGGPGSERAESLARSMAEGAAALSPDAGDTRLALAMTRFNGGDPVGAVREAAAALAVAPYNAEAHGLLGRIRLEIGPIEDAMRRCEWSLSLEPEAPLMCGDMARAHAFLGNWEQSDAYSKVGLTTSGYGPSWFLRLRLMLWRREGAKLEETLHEALRGTDPRAHTIARGLIEVLRGNLLPSQVTAMVPMLHDAAGRRRTAFFRQIATEASAFAGHHEETLACLTQSIEAGLIDLVWLDHCPLLDRARQDTRFYALRARVQARAVSVGRAFGNT